MPVGYAPAYTGTQGTITVPGAVTGGPVRASAAVALTNDGTQATLVECGSTHCGDRFFGFACKDGPGGSSIAVVTSRGSNVTPIVEGGVPLIPNGRVYLSATPGEVTQTPPSLGTPSTFIQVGIAVTETDMVLITDARFGISG
jgi:hypothetical protein